MKKYCEKNHKKNIHTSKRGVKFCANCPTDVSLTKLYIKKVEIEAKIKKLEAIK